MTIKKMFIMIYAVTALLLIGLVTTTMLMFRSQRALEEAQDNRYDSFIVANDLRTNSENLTRLARTFVVTQEPKYEQEYWQLVDISNGVKPRKDGRTVSFTQLMKELNFAQAEFDKIKESEEKSNALVATEERAMNAAKGLYADANGKYTVKGKPDLDLARDLVHNAEYHRQRDIILQPIDEFFTMLDHRTAAAVDASQTQTQFYLYFSFALILIVMAIQVVSYFFIHRKVNLPIGRLQDAVGRVASGDLSASVVAAGNDEIASLSSGFNIMVGNIKKGNEALEQEKAGIQQKVDEAVRESEEQKNYLSRSVETLLREMNKFSEGDLNIGVQAERNDTIGDLYNGFNTVVRNMKEMLTNVRDAVQATANSSSEISASTEQMAAGAQEQSSQTTEVAGAVEQMTKTILETTRNASAAAETAKNAGRIAKEGGSVVQETIQGMNRIAEVVKQSAATVSELGKSSDQIGEIVQVIDDIADQTNLLALNAAIEAARAGEQGRGFAVVADEVRKLAERTTKATKEIAGMIKQIQKDTAGAVQSMDAGTIEVEKGKLMADKAGVSLTEIISAAQSVGDMVNQVAAASEEQSSAAEQISKNIESIDSVTKESAAGVQQIARASEDLNRLTENLHALISRFRIDGASSAQLRSVQSAPALLVRRKELR
ncbi:MAG: methyl-accepting chemotaxis protein [Acidobacteriota bacterium]